MAKYPPRKGMLASAHNDSMSQCVKGEIVSDFAITCPHCGAANDDPFEVLTRGAADWHSCIDCKQRFYYLIGECDTCEAESTFSWPEEPVGITLSDLKCSECGSQYGHGHESRLSSEELG